MGEIADKALPDDLARESKFQWLTRVGFLYYWPVMLALISQSAPPKISATLMGGAFLALFLGTVLMGWVGSFYEEMSNAAFWTLDAAIAFAGAVLIFLLHKMLDRRLHG
jgi:POT family proton-dependent oligopeptide transporter